MTAARQRNGILTLVQMLVALCCAMVGIASFTTLDTIYPRAGIEPKDGWKILRRLTVRCSYSAAI
jgi:hypothetical protein